MPSYFSLRRADGSWSDHDFNVFDGGRKVGRIYRATDHLDSPWFWTVAPQLASPKSGHASTFDKPAAGFKAEYEDWKSCVG